MNAIVCVQQLVHFHLKFDVTASLNNVDTMTALDAILKSTGYVASRKATSSSWAPPTNTVSAITP